ncbi:MAG: hypothetical protein LBI78_04015 [Campylobacteraceae bacterium]|jgi:hypothetical protein|nr:hypothetical protein [Campylobacteraceae bacterium]
MINIYIFRGPDKCVHSYFTNRDERVEKVIGWAILSGEEDCKMITKYVFSF